MQQTLEETCAAIDAEYAALAPAICDTELVARHYTQEAEYAHMSSEHWRERCLTLEARARARWVWIAFGFCGGGLFGMIALAAIRAVAA